MVKKAIQISNTNNKWGVGKSTITINLATILATQGKKVLVVDLDHQCNLSQALLWMNNFDGKEKNAWELFNLNSKYSVKDLIVESSFWVDVIPGKVDDVFLLERQLDYVLDSIATTNKILDEYIEWWWIEKIAEIRKRMKELWDIKQDNLKILQKRISEILYEYDYVFYDLPPSVSTIPKNAWVTSDYLLVPVSDYFSLYGTEGLITKMVEIKKIYNQNLKFIFFYNKVPITKNRTPGEHIWKEFLKIMNFLEDAIFSNEYLASISRVMSNFIRYSTEIEKCYGKSVTILESWSPAIKNDFIEFSKEFISITD